MLTHPRAINQKLLRLALLPVQIQLAILDVKDGVLSRLSVGALRVELVVRDVQDELVLGGAALGEVDGGGGPQRHNAELADGDRA